MGESVRDTILQRINEAGWDGRINRYRIEFIEKPEFRVNVKVDSEALFEKMQEILYDTCPENAFELYDMSDLLPSDYRHAMIVLPVCDMREEAKLRSERIHQLVFGEWVKVLESNNTHFLVKDAKNGYVGYVPIHALDFCSEDEKKSIKSLPKFFVGERFAYLSGLETGFQGENDLGWIPLGSHLYVARESEQGFYIMTPSKEYWVLKHDCFVAEEKPVTEVDSWVDKYLHVPYLWGGCSTYGTDCSGFVGRIFDMMGFSLPRDTDQQMNFVKTLNESELEKGDLIFFPGHVGLYMGKGYIIHSNVTLGGVTFSQIGQPRNHYEHYLKSSITGFGRVPRKSS
jgi:hypothetical protein